MSERMKLTIKPLLTITPGSIAGSGGKFAIGFTVVQFQNLTEFDVKYEILNKAGYRFKKPELKDLPMKYDVSADGMAATRFLLGDAPKKGLWSQDVFIVSDPAFGGNQAAALKIAATVKGQGNKGTLKAVKAVGSIAMLSGGLTKLVNDHFAENPVPAGVTDFEGKAREFVRQKQKELKGRFKSFDELDPRTIVNAVLGRTDPQKRTVESLSPVIKHFRDQVTFPASLTDKTSAEK